MARLIERTLHPETRERVYLWDDGSETVFNERTKEWTLFRVPPANEISAAVHGDPDAQQLIAEYTKGIRYTPPVLADAPRHSADVAEDDDNG